MSTEAISRSSAPSLYVHVPFCVVKCGYCDFTSYVIDDPDVHDLFVRALDSELVGCGVPRNPGSVFIGGGTPSRLAPERLAGLFASIHRLVDLRSCSEVTMEVNPESVTAERIAIARDAGVNRISMGVQSFDDRHLAFLDRVHSADQVRRAYSIIREAGMSNVSLDLIFSLPGQTVAEWHRDLDAALELGPDHLSCYSLTFEPGTRLHRDLLAGKVERADEETDRAMFSSTRERLTAAGFAAYEISNFAGRGGPCRHNDHYWLQGDYIGVGPGASSHRAGVRSKNLTAVEAWARAALAGVPPTATAECLTPSQRIGEAMWLGIRRTDGIDLTRIEQRVGHRVETDVMDQVLEQERTGLVERDGARIRLTPAGLLLADHVGATYLR